MKCVYHNYYNDVITAYAVETEVGSPLLKNIFHVYRGCAFKPILQRDTSWNILQSFSHIQWDQFILRGGKLCPFLILFFSFLTKLACLFLTFSWQAVDHSCFNWWGKTSETLLFSRFLFINTGSIQAFKHTVTPWQLNSW